MVWRWRKISLLWPRGTGQKESGWEKPLRTWESPCVGDGSYGEVEIEETDGSCSRQKECDLSVLFMEAYGLEIEEELSTLATQ